MPACAGDARLHAPRIGRSFPARDHGVGATYQVAVHQGVFAPGSLAPRRLPVPRVRRHIRASSWPLRFLAPEAIATPFVSPHNQHGSHRPYCSATLQSRDLLNRTRDRSPSPEAVQPRRPTPRHPEFGRLRISLRQGACSIHEVWKVWGKFSVVPNELKDLGQKICWVWGHPGGFAALAGCAKPRITRAIPTRGPIPVRAQARSVRGGQPDRRRHWHYLTSACASFWKLAFTSDTRFTAGTPR